MRNLLLVALASILVQSSFAQSTFTCEEMLKYSSYYKKLRQSHQEGPSPKEEVVLSLEKLFALKAQRGTYKLESKKVPLSLQKEINKEEKKLSEIKKRYEKIMCKDFVPKCMKLFSHNSKGRKSRASDLDIKTIESAFKSCRGICPGNLQSLTTYTTRNGGVVEGKLHARFIKAYPSKIDRKYAVKWPIDFLIENINSVKGGAYCKVKLQKKCTPEGEDRKSMPCCKGLSLDSNLKGTNSKGVCVDSSLVKNFKINDSENNDKKYFYQNIKKSKSKVESKVINK